MKRTPALLLLATLLLLALAGPLSASATVNPGGRVPIKDLI